MVVLRRFALALCLALASLAGCTDEGGAGSAAKTPGKAKGPGGPDGEKLYQSTCAACHGPDARGLTGLGKNLTTSTFVDQQSLDQMVAFLQEGREAGHPLNTTGIAMPPKGGNPALTDADLRAIAEYVKALPPKY